RPGGAPPPSGRGFTPGGGGWGGPGGAARARARAAGGGAARPPRRPRGGGAAGGGRVPAAARARTGGARGRGRRHAAARRRARRERELRILDGVLEQCASERVASAVLVTAPAGVGKSRLRSEFIARARARGATDFALLLGRGEALSAGSAFALLARALRREF